MCLTREQHYDIDFASENEFHELNVDFKCYIENSCVDDSSVLSVYFRFIDVLRGRENRFRSSLMILLEKTIYSLFKM